MTKEWLLTEDESDGLDEICLLEAQARKMVEYIEMQRKLCLQNRFTCKYCSGDCAFMRDDCAWWQRLKKEVNNVRDILVN
jgi:hypothetical protein